MASLGERLVADDGDGFDAKSEASDWGNLGDGQEAGTQDRPSLSQPQDTAPDDIMQPAPQEALPEEMPPPPVPHDHRPHLDRLEEHVALDAKDLLQSDYFGACRVTARPSSAKSYGGWQARCLSHRLYARSECKRFFRSLQSNLVVVSFQGLL